MRVRDLVGIVGLMCVAHAANMTIAPTPSTTHIPLRPFVIGVGPSAGVLVRASINGGPALRLLLDSGAQNLVLKRKAALRSGCDGGDPIELLGAQRGLDARLVHGATLDIGAFALHDVDVVVTDRNLADGIDGVVPLSIFSDHLIRLDLAHKTLELLPLPDERDESAARTRVSSNLLFVSCRVNRDREGFFLVDTGAAYTVISRRLANELSPVNPLDSAVAMRAGGVDLEARRTSAVRSLAVGAADLTPGSVVAVDLSEASRHHPFEIHGMLGFSSFRDRVLLVNYRDSSLRIEQ